MSEWIDHRYSSKRHVGGILWLLVEQLRDGTWDASDPVATAHGLSDRDAAKLAAESAARALLMGALAELAAP